MQVYINMYKEKKKKKERNDTIKIIFLINSFLFFSFTVILRKIRDLDIHIYICIYSPNDLNEMVDEG